MLCRHFGQSQNFEIDDQTGLPVSREEADTQHYTRVQILQRLAHKYYGTQLKDFALGSAGAVSESREALLSHLNRLSDEELLSLGRKYDRPPIYIYLYHHQPRLFCHPDQDPDTTPVYTSFHCLEEVRPWIVDHERLVS